ncbi:MAG: L,D-transpeptidase family protein [Bacteroidota bacterium]
MKALAILLLTASLLFLQTLAFGQQFKTNQLKYSRPKTAFKEKAEDFRQLLNSAGIDQKSLRIYLRAFKREGILELWAKNKDDQAYQLIKTYAICSGSGDPGPKRMEGDFQVPEGFYHIDRFNPWSNFYLSLGINYPNKSDKILGKKGKLGGDIFIHGNCVTIGCIPITDDQIKELYVFTVEAKHSGQQSIPVNIFPARMTDAMMVQLKKEHNNPELISFWEDIKPGFDHFEKYKQLPSIIFLPNGKHQIR